MAEWIKWSKGLSRRREVIVMARTLSISRREAACACMEFWEWADSETTNGRIPGATAEDIDQMLGIQGFAAALESVGWICKKDEAISIPRWSRNNGASAKRRAMHARNVARKRKLGKPESESNRAHTKRTPASPDKSKRREEKKESPNGDSKNPQPPLLSLPQLMVWSGPPTKKQATSMIAVVLPMPFVASSFQGVGVSGSSVGEG